MRPHRRHRHRQALPAATIETHEQPKRPPASAQSRSGRDHRRDQVSRQDRSATHRRACRCDRAADRRCCPDIARFSIVDRCIAFEGRRNTRKDKDSPPRQEKIAQEAQRCHRPELSRCGPFPWAGEALEAIVTRTPAIRRGTERRHEQAISRLDARAFPRPQGPPP